MYIGTFQHRCISRHFNIRLYLETFQNKKNIWTTLKMYLDTLQQNIYSISRDKRQIIRYFLQDWWYVFQIKIFPQFLSKMLNKRSQEGLCWLMQGKMPNRSVLEFLLLIPWLYLLVIVFVPNWTSFFHFWVNS